MYKYISYWLSYWCLLYKKKKKKEKKKKEEEEWGVIERRHSSWMARNWEVEEEKLETVG